jgi:hypothetical protein
MGETEMELIAELVVDALARPDDDLPCCHPVRVESLADEFPLYADEPAEAGR